jgi:hypothetical protein
MTEATTQSLATRAQLIDGCAPRSIDPTSSKTIAAANPTSFIAQKALRNGESG